MSWGICDHAGAHKDDTGESRTMRDVRTVTVLDTIMLLIELESLDGQGFLVEKFDRSEDDLESPCYDSRCTDEMIQVHVGS